MCRVDAKECIPKAIVSFLLEFSLEAKDEQIACEI